MDFKVGDDGELEFIEIEEKPKRKRKPKPMSLRGCMQAVFLLIIFALSGIGGFAYFFLQNPNILSSIQHTSGATCVPWFNGLSVSDASVFFQTLTGNEKSYFIEVTMDGHAHTTRGLSKAVDSFDVISDGVRVVMSRMEPVAPYSFIYTIAMDDPYPQIEHLLTDGQYPAWSPDGKQIAFFKYKGEERTDLYIMDADGSNARFVRKGGLVEAPPSWSPDGKQLVFSTADFGERTQNIYIINIETGAEQALVKNGLSASHPEWSPDGKSVAYISYDLYIINVNGSNRHNLTNSQFTSIFNVGWSPDSMTLAFIAQDKNYVLDLNVMDSDGAGIHAIGRRSCPI